MSRKVVIAGNWKMNKTGAEGKAFVEEFIPKVKDINNVEIVVCPTYTALEAVVEAAKGSNVKVGSQNIHWAESGAFTGEISAEMLKAIGVEYVIIGHSERRQYFGETDATVNQRIKAALAANLKTMFCIGEVLEDRESGNTNSILDVQIRNGLVDITASDMDSIIVAYEPVWAIGTGKTATPEMAEETHAFVRSVLVDMFGQEVADKVRIQYGGSMKAANSAELVGQENIDGGLIGGAALEAESFYQLIKNASN